MTDVRRTRPRGQLPTKKPKVELGSVQVLPGSSVSLVVLGRPAPQGSKTPFLEEANPRTVPWRKAIADVCKELPAGFDKLDGPLVADLWFFFDPPKTAVRGDIPCTKYTYDVDKLCRAMFDGLTDGGVVVDDARIADAHLHKRYVWPEEGEARAVVLVSPLRIT